MVLIMEISVMIKIEKHPRVDRFIVDFSGATSVYVTRETLEQWRDEITKILDTPEENYK